MAEHTFSESGHVHMFDGKKVKGVTTPLEVIAKPALIQWAADLAAVEALHDDELTRRYKEIADMPYGPDRDKAKKLIDKDFPAYKAARLAHRKKKEDAADWGKIVHKAIEVWIKTGAVPTAIEIDGRNYILEEDHLKAINNFVNWATQNNVSFLCSEKLIHSNEWEMGGIVDFVATIGGKLLVGDIKTSSGIWESYWLQCSAYAKMMMEMGLYNNFDGMIIVNCKKDGTINVEERKDVAGNIKCYEAAIILHNRMN